MKKLFYYNFNVGSGIEYTGNVILEWLKEIENIEIYEQKHQDQSPHLITEMIREKPDVVVLNEIYHKSTDTTYYYKKFFPDTKVICIVHSYDGLMIKFEDQGENNTEDSAKVWFTVKFYNESMDHAITLNGPVRDVEFPLWVKDKIIKSWFPVNPKVYKPIIPWNERKKLFCYMGYIMPIKVSTEFLDKYKNYNGIEIDFYSEISSYLDDDYKRKVLESGINILPMVPQNSVSEILNQYKYFVLPHGRFSEIFNVTLLQSILCGTIPLVCNDRTDRSFDYRWIDWAKGLYFGCNKEDELLSNLVKLKNDNPDLSEVSFDIVERAREKFAYEKNKTDFQNLIKTYL
jgi:hypothetical protein